MRALPPSPVFSFPPRGKCLTPVQQRTQHGSSPLTARGFYSRRRHIYAWGAKGARRHVISTGGLNPFDSSTFMCNTSDYLSKHVRACKSTLPGPGCALKLFYLFHINIVCIKTPRQISPLPHLYRLHTDLRFAAYATGTGKRRLSHT